MSENLPDIRYFLMKYPKWTDSKSSDLVQKPLKQTSYVKDIAALSQDDLVRREHDRGKKRKKTKQIV